MTTDIMQPFREEHAHLLVHVEHIRLLARDVPSLGVEERKERLASVLGFLEGTLFPHAHAEEQVLYPAVAGILGDPRATAPMIHDHVVIKRYAASLAEADADDAPRLSELLYGLHALVLAHFEKEEELYLPLLAEHPEQAAAVVEALEVEHSGHAH